MSAYDRLGHFSSGYFRLVLVRSDYDMLDKVRPG
jgi:hypothetical protein